MEAIFNEDMPPKRGTMQRYIPNAPKPVPCPADYSTLSPDLVCKLHGQLKRCPKCKDIIHPTRGNCQCGVTIQLREPKAPRKRSTGAGKGNPGKARVGRKPELKDCLFCGTKSRRQLCEEHLRYRGTIQWWTQRTGKGTVEVVEMIKTGFANEENCCVECGRSFTYKSTSGKCRKCALRTREPSRYCITCGDACYSKTGYFCKKVRCSRVSLRFSYHRRSGKTDEEIFNILKEPIERVKRGLDP